MGEDRSRDDYYEDPCVLHEGKDAVTLKEKLVFLHIMPYNKDIYHHIQYSTAFL